MKKYKTVFIIIFCLGVFNSCKKDKTKLEEAPIPKGNIGFHMHITINDVEADSGLVMTNQLSKQNIRLDVAKLYISGITVYKVDGTALPVPGKHLLIHMGEENYTIGEVSTGNYNRLSFYVGVDAQSNSNSPELYTGVLGPQKPSMWFGNTEQGYVFVNASGAVDSTKSLTGKVNRKFAYQLGSNAQRIKIEIPAMRNNSSITVSSLNSPGLPAQFHLLCDFGILLQDLETRTANSVVTPFNSDSVVLKPILMQIPRSFVMKNKRFSFFGTLVFLCFMFSCMKKQKQKDLPEVVSFSKDILPIFRVSCTTAGCHAGNVPAGNLNLESDVAYAELFAKKDIDTLNPDASTLYKELASGAMPKGSRKLDDYSIGLVQKWIQQKAKNN